MAESEEELKSLLMKVKEESEKVGLNSTFRKLRSWHVVIGKDSDAGRDWGQGEKGTTEDGITDLMDTSLSDLLELVMVLGPNKHHDRFQGLR